MKQARKFFLEFLEEFNFISRPLNININGISPSGLFLGRGKNGLEIAVFKSINSPNNNILQRAYKERKDGRATPILIVIAPKDPLYVELMESSLQYLTGRFRSS